MSGRQASLDDNPMMARCRCVKSRIVFPPPSSAWSIKRGLREVRDAIAQLPEKQRAAVLMHKYEELEYSQIASALGCSESAVKSLLFRAYESLRARLEHMVAGE